jgi:Lipase (class 3)
MIPLADISGSVFSTAPALARCKMIVPLWSDYTVAQAQAYLTQEQLPPSIVRYVQSSPLGSPRRYLYNVGTDYWLFINGIASLGQGIDVWDGYAGPVITRALGDFGKNRTMNAWAGEIFRENRDNLRAATNLFVVGHSAGAYVALLFARLMEDFLNNNCRISVECFGMPKIGTTESLPVRAQQHHWFNSDDPVCVIPPVPGFDQPWLAALGPVQIVALTYFGTPIPGTQIGLTGTLRDLPAPVGLPDPEWVSAGGWLYALTSGTDTPHNVPNYLARLTLALPEPFVPEVLPETRTRAGAPPMAQGVAAAMQRSAVQTSYYSPREIPSGQVTIPEEVRFTVRKIARRVYGVYFGKTEIMVAPRKRLAQFVARTGNALLRGLPRATRVDIDALTEQLNAVLTLGKTDIGFIPNIQDA